MSAFKSISREDQSLDEVKKVMIDTAHQVLDAEVVNLYMLDEAAKQFWCTHTPDDTSPFVEDIRVPLGEGMVGSLVNAHGTVNEVFERESQLPSNDESLVQPPSANCPGGWHARAVVCVAIVKGSKTVGALQVINKKATKGAKKKKKKKKKKDDETFTRTDELMLEAFAMQIAPVVARRMTEVMFSNAVTQGSEQSASLLAAFSGGGAKDQSSEAEEVAVYVEAPTSPSPSDAITINATVGLELPSIDALKEWGYGCLDFSVHGHSCI